MTSLFGVVSIAWFGLLRPYTALEPLPTTDLAGLPLDERCAIAHHLAFEILKAAEFGTASFPKDKPLPPRDGDTLRIFISRYDSLRDEDRLRREEAIFRNGEICPATDTNIYSFYAPGPGVKLEIATGATKDLPKGRMYLFISTRPLNRDRWEFSWRYGDNILSCPKSAGEVPDVCTRSWPVVEDRPTLKVVLKRAKKRYVEIDIDQVVLEFVPTNGKER